MVGKKYWSLIIMLLMLTGCTMTTIPLSGTIFTDIKGPLDIDPVQVKGRKVEGRATVQGILGFATGDCSLEAAVKDALSKSPGATKLINITVDYHAKTVLCVYSKFTTIVKGIPVK